MKGILITGLIFLFLAVSVVLAQEVYIKAEADKAVITTDETLTYKLVITSSEQKLPAPKLPNFEGFNVLSQAESSTISLVESKIKTVIVYAFILSPTGVGKFKISPSSIDIKKKTYSSEALEIEVKKGKTKAGPIPEQNPPSPEENPPESEQPKITL